MRSAYSLADVMMRSLRTESPFVIAPAPITAGARGSGGRGVGGKDVRGGSGSSVGADRSAQQSSLHATLQSGVGLTRSTHQSSMSQRDVSRNQPTNIDFDRRTGDLAFTPPTPAGSLAARSALPVRQVFSQSQSDRTPAVQPSQVSAIATKEGVAVAAAADTAVPHATTARPLFTSSTVAADLPLPLPQMIPRGQAARSAASVPASRVPRQPVSVATDTSSAATAACDPPVPQSSIRLVLRPHSEQSTTASADLSIPAPPKAALLPVTPAAASTTAQLDNLSLSSQSTQPAARPALDTSRLSLPPQPVDSLHRQPRVANVVESTLAMQPIMSQPVATEPAAEQRCQRCTAKDRAKRPLEEEEMSETERLAEEAKQDEAAKQLRDTIEAGQADADNFIAQHNRGVNDRYNVMLDEHEAKMSELLGGRSVEDMEEAVKRWQAGLAVRKMQELNIEVQDRIRHAVDSEQADLDCSQHCRTAVSIINAELERQRRMEEDENCEVDDELTAELRQETIHLGRSVDMYRRAAERLRVRVTEEAQRQRQAAQRMETVRELRKERFKRDEL